jgi:hypothetical protein
MHLVCNYAWHSLPPRELMTTLDRWLPGAVTLGTWAGYCWLAGPYGPLEGFLVSAVAVVGIGAVAVLLG